MITLTMKMMMKLGFLFFPHFFALQFAKLLMAIKDEGTASCLCLCLGLQPEIPAEIVEPFRRGSCCCCRFVFFFYIFNSLVLFLFCYLARDEGDLVLNFILKIKE